MTSAPHYDPLVYADDPKRLRNEADALWGRYVSTCHTGGTPEQRAWAFRQANRAENICAAAARSIRAAKRDHERRVA